MRLSAFSRTAPLAAISLTEMAAPFARMVILAHMLGPFELGFAAAISAVYATVELITDTSLYRFVLTAPRERYREALATAHGISLMRGLLVGALFLALAYPTGYLMVDGGDWHSFLWLAPIAFIKSLENLDLRVAERDYRYWPQLTATLASHVAGVAALLAVGLATRTHDGLIAYLLTQVIVFVALTHILAKTRYSWTIRGQLIGSALTYSLPLMLNGAGIAAAAQGDRLFVGAYFGLEQLGLYAVMVLTAYVPTSALFRLSSPIILAGFVNAAEQPKLLLERLKLFSRVMPIMAATYALGWILLGKIAVPLVFGSRFVIHDAEIMLVGLIVYVRICRGEPNTSLLLKSGMTRTMALANQVPIIGLMIGAGLALKWNTLSALLVGTLTGEILTFAVVLLVSRKVWRGATGGVVAWSAAMAVPPLCVGAFFLLSDPSDHLLARAILGAGCIVLIAAALWFGVKPRVRSAYGRAAAPAPAPEAQQVASAE